jgi:hypothetical protein
VFLHKASAGQTVRDYLTSKGSPSGHGDILPDSSIGVSRVSAAFALSICQAPLRHAFLPERCPFSAPDSLVGRPCLATNSHARAHSFDMTYELALRSDLTLQAKYARLECGKQAPVPLNFQHMRIEQAPDALTDDSNLKARSPIFFDVTIAAHTDSAVHY